MSESAVVLSVAAMRQNGEWDPVRPVTATGHPAEFTDSANVMVVAGKDRLVSASQESAGELHLNEVNIIENGFLKEFQNVVVICAHKRRSFPLNEKTWPQGCSTDGAFGVVTLAVALPSWIARVAGLCRRVFPYRGLRSTSPGYPRHWIPAAYTSTIRV
jgi:hypothetical protein